VLFTQSNRARLVDFIGVYWLLSGFLTIQWSLTVRWRRGSRIGLAAGSSSVIAGALVLLRQQLQHLISPNELINVLGVAAFLTGSLRLLGAFEIERSTVRRWTFGGLALGSVEVGRFGCRYRRGRPPRGPKTETSQPDVRLSVGFLARPNGRSRVFGMEGVHGLRRFQLEGVRPTERPPRGRRSPVSGLLAG